MAVVLDYETGRVLWMKEDRTCETLSEFFRLTTEEQRKRLEAIAMDMWDPYIKALQENDPHVKIVFDLYHVVAAFGRVIDAVRNLEYQKASKSKKKVMHQVPPLDEQTKHSDSKRTPTPQSATRHEQNAQQTVHPQG